jgi:hypothetical protein
MTKNGKKWQKMENGEKWQKIAPFLAIFHFLPFPAISCYLLPFLHNPKNGKKWREMAKNCIK